MDVELLMFNLHYQTVYAESNRALKEMESIQEGEVEKAGQHSALLELSLEYHKNTAILNSMTENMSQCHVRALLSTEY